MLIYFLMQGKCLINSEGDVCKLCSPRNKYYTSFSSACNQACATLSALCCDSQRGLVSISSLDWLSFCLLGFGSIAACYLKRNWGSKQLSWSIVPAQSRSEQLGHPTQEWAAIPRGGQGDRDKVGTLTPALCWRGEAGLAWQRHKARKILTGISSIEREGRELSLLQEKGCILFFQLHLLKTIFVHIFCDLFLWEFCIEIGNWSNERGKNSYVELTGKCYCSCFSWSCRSQSCKEREERLVAPCFIPGLPCGSECLSALSQVIFLPSCISGAPVSLSALQRLALGWGQVKVSFCWQPPEFRTERASLEAWFLSYQRHAFVSM